MTSEETLYDRIGGADGVDEVVEDFYDRVLTDEALEPYFEGVDTEALRAHQAAFVAAAAGGPGEYDGEALDLAHEDLDITDEAFDRVADHLDAALRACDVAAADREELLAIVAGQRSAVVTA